MTKNMTSEKADDKTSLTGENSLAKITGSELAKMITKRGVTDMIRPLVKEIKLFETHVSGVLETDGKILNALKVGDKLILRKNLDERFDDDEVSILNEKEEKVGYIPERDAIIFSRLMSAGKLLTAKVVSINLEKDVPLIKITIYLVDY